MEEADALDIKAQSLAEDFKRQVSAFSGAGLTGFAELFKSRAADMKDRQESLKSELGPNHPQVAIDSKVAESAQELSARLETEASRERRRPIVNPNEWAVYGRVFDAIGQPAVGVQVRLYDKDLLYDDLLGVAETDEFGDFALSYGESDFKELCEGGGADLYLMIKDASGNALYSSSDSVRPNSGRAEYFEIKLSEKSAEIPPPSKGKKRKDK